MASYQQWLLISNLYLISRSGNIVSGENGIFASMKELIGHIESLLLTNDCVIVPEFGGFIAFNVPAKWAEEKNLFSPPMRTVGFNPQLKLNDGLVVQAYMSAYGTNFPDASKRVTKATRELKRQLMSNGMIELQGLGTLRVAMDGSFHFVPFVDGLYSPALYGLGELHLASFASEETPVVQQKADRREPSPFLLSNLPPEEPSSLESGSRRSGGVVWRVAIASAAAVALFFLLSVPVGNVGTVPYQRAQVVASGLFDQSAGSHPLKPEQENLAAALPDSTALDTLRETGREEREERTAASLLPANTSSAEENGKSAMPPPAPSVHPDSYFVIVAAFSKERVAEATAATLRKEGYSEACVIGSPRIHKVAIASYAAEEEAIQALRRFRGGKYEDAWVFKNK